MRNLSISGNSFLSFTSKFLFAFMFWSFSVGQILNAQNFDWKWQNPLPTGNTLIDVFFTDSQNGWVVGDAGTIFKTANGGTTWVQQNSGTTNSISSIYFADSENGWAVGGFGNILKTSDSGNIWTNQISGTANSLYGVYFTAGLTGYAVGESGTILKTTNGGATWDTQTSGTTALLNQVYFLDSQNGWAVGALGAILKTTNGGANWTAQTSGTNFFVTDVFFRDTQKGWAVAINGLILKTTNGGTTWTPNNSGIGGVADGIYSIFFTSDVNGWLAGPDGIIRKTNNGGNTWNNVNSFTANDLMAIFFIDGLEGRAVGKSGVILKTENGGNTWTKDGVVSTSQNLKSVYFHDTQKGSAVGNKSTIVSTGNGGASWTMQNSGTTANLYGITFSNLQTGWVVGDSGIVLKSTNGGTSWQKRIIDIYTLLDVSFPNPDNGWAVGIYGRIKHTSNGGNTWTNQSSNTGSNLRDVQFLNPGLGWAVGDSGTIIKTTNGGTTWLSQNPGNFFDFTSVFFVDNQTGWITGFQGKIIKTTNGGDSWQSQNSGVGVPFFTVQFLNSQIGYVAGEFGIVRKTTNGGQTWLAHASGSPSRINSIAIGDESIAWAVGNEGSIITTIANNLLDPNALSTLVSGRTFEKTGATCVPGTVSMPGIVVKAMPGPYYALTQNNGNYGLRIPNGASSNNYTLQVVPPSNIVLQTEVNCPPDNQIPVTIGTNPDTLNGKDFGLKITECHHMDVQIASNRRRRCFFNTTSVYYSNQGSITAPGAYILVEFPNLVRPVSCPTPHLAVNDSVWRFNIGDVAPGVAGEIYIMDSVLCRDVLDIGKMQCTKATIFPAPDCPPPSGWTGAEVDVDGTCNNGLVYLGIYNRTNVNMVDSVDYWVYLDSILVKQSKVRLAAGDSLKLIVEAQGLNVHLTANQVPFHPTEVFVSTTIENCQDTTIFFPRPTINRFAKQQTPNSKRHCLPIFGAFDPNDKQVFPIGFTSQNIIPPNTKLEYLVRFQNTGNDTAFTVFVIDTLDSNLNPESFEMGATSHSYQLRMQTTQNGKTFLRWQFNNIQLPDSNTNEPASNGFVQFRISPKAGLALGSQVRNHSEIYFDFNPPIITNQTLSTFDNIVFLDPGLNDNVQVVTETKGSITPEQIGVNLYPNPVTDHSLTADFQTKGSLTLFNAQGQLVFEKQNIEGKQVLPIQLRTGFYMAQVKTNKGLSVVKIIVE